MKYSKEELDSIYKVRKEEEFVEASKVPLKWYSPFDKDKFNLINTEFKNDGHYLRFSLQELEAIKDVSSDVYLLAKFSSGIQLLFITDARIIKLRVENITDFPMNNMPFIARAGFDSYYKENEDEEFKFFYPTFAPNFESNTKWEDYVLAFHENKKRIIVINFPLYNGVKELSIGLEEDREVKPYFYQNKKRIVCYGTSILEGGCVSHPGEATTNQLSMKLKQEVLNYGFSGAALCEKEIATIIASRENVEMFVLDAEANAGWSEKLANNFFEFVKIIYDKHPNVPIIVMNRLRCNQDDENYSYVQRMKEFGDKVLLDTVNYFKEQGKRIYFVDNFSLFDNSDFTVDGLHPSSLGFIKLNEAYLKAIEKVKKDL